MTKNRLTKGEQLAVWEKEMHQLVTDALHPDMSIKKRMALLEALKGVAGLLQEHLKDVAEDLDSTLHTSDHD